jgi:hypothetical protein
MSSSSWRVSACLEAISVARTKEGMLRPTPPGLLIAQSSLSGRERERERERERKKIER